MNKKAIICYVGIGVAIVVVPELLLRPRAPQSKPAVVAGPETARMAVSGPVDNAPGGLQETAFYPSVRPAPPGLLLENPPAISLNLVLLYDTILHIEFGTCSNLDLSELDNYGLKENRNLYDAIYWKESSNGQELTGDNGTTFGPYHISLAYHQDACEEIAKTYHVPLETVLKTFDFDKFIKPQNDENFVWPRHRIVSELIMKFYWQRYGADTDEKKCRMHNGGWNGMNKKSTEKYWREVKTYMERHKWTP